MKKNKNDATSLIKARDIASALHSEKFGGFYAATMLMSAFKLDIINNLYSRHGHKTGLEFANDIISDLKINFELQKEELNRIPRAGSCVIIANHPFGGIEALILFKLLVPLRPDLKILGNYLLEKIEPLKDFIIPVDPFDHPKIKTNLSGLKLGLSHVKDGNALLIFPAGEVSSQHLESGTMDKKWPNSIIKFIRKCDSPVIPIYISGQNSNLFYFLGMIHPALRTIKIPSEMLNKHKIDIRLRIGNPVSLKEQMLSTNVSRYGRFLRAKTYALGTSIEVGKFFSSNFKLPKNAKKIISPLPADNIIVEIENIKTKFLLFEHNQFRVFCAPSSEIPNILNEIGRLRETTFREIGEGTNQKSDLDEYDLYYNQMFIWDSQESKIAGAYRIGKGKDIIAQYGVKGFYISSLFKIKKKIYPVLEQSLELGRSFIIKEYQKQPMPLFLLWKGILYYLLKNQKYRYLTGPVSISNKFSVFSKGLIIKFIMSNHYSKEFAQYVKPRKPYKIKNSRIDTKILLENYNDLSRFDKLIQDIEADNSRMPVLLKKYLQLNGKIVAFNLDPKFNNAVDGLMVLDLYDVPVDVINNLSKELNENLLDERFNFKTMAG